MTMNLNPLSLLEKAIDEHGSANILRERVALVREQLAAAEQKLVDANLLIRKHSQTIVQLHVSISQFQSKIQEQQSQIENLNLQLNPLFMRISIQIKDKATSMAFDGLLTLLKSAGQSMVGPISEWVFQ